MSPRVRLTVDVYVFAKEVAGWGVRRWALVQVYFDVVEGWQMRKARRSRIRADELAEREDLVNLNGDQLSCLRTDQAVERN